MKVHKSGETSQHPERDATLGAADQQQHQLDSDAPEPHPTIAPTSENDETSPSGVAAPSHQQSPGVTSAVAGPVTWEAESISIPDFGMHNDDILWDMFDPADYELPETFQIDMAELSCLAAFERPQPAVMASALGPTQPASRASQPPWFDQAARGESDHQSKWYSFLEYPILSHKTPNLVSEGPITDIGLDDRHRDHVERYLSDLPQNSSLPPTPVLNSCLRHVMERFLCLLPMVHVPTFRPTDSNSLLLVGMCTLGSQLVSSVAARDNGMSMFDSLHRVVLSNWPLRTRDVLPIMQAVVFGQTFAMLCGESHHLMTAQAFHGTTVFAYRQAAKSMRRHYTTESTTGSEPTNANATIREQAIVRIGLALHIQDAELALLGHQAPLMRQQEMLPGCHSDEDYFVANSLLLRKSKVRNPANNSIVPGEGTASIDAASHGSEPSTSAACPTLLEYATLSSILASIAEQRYFSDAGKHLRTCENELNQWMTARSDRVDTLTNHGLRLCCLWHSGWLAVLCDLNMLEIANGRDGPSAADEVRDQVSEWASSEHSQKAMLHAYAIQRDLETMTLSEVPAIHIPRCAYHAGLVLASISIFATSDAILFNGAKGLESHTNFQTMMNAGLLSAWDWRQLAADYNTKQKVADQAASMAILLRRLACWGISQKFAITLEAMCSSDRLVTKDARSASAM